MIETLIIMDVIHQLYIATTINSKKKKKKGFVPSIMHLFPQTAAQNSWKLKIHYMKNKTRLHLTNLNKHATGVMMVETRSSHSILLRSTLCWAWGLASWISPQASIQQGKLHLGCPAHTAKPAGHKVTMINLEGDKEQQESNAILNNKINQRKSLKIIKSVIDLSLLNTWSVLFVSSTLRPMARLLMVECCITPSLSIMKSPLNAMPYKRLKGNL